MGIELPYLWNSGKPGYYTANPANNKCSLYSKSVVFWIIFRAGVMRMYELIFPLTVKHLMACKNETFMQVWSGLGPLMHTCSCHIIQIIILLLFQIETLYNNKKNRNGCWIGPTTAW